MAARTNLNPELNTGIIKQKKPGRSEQIRSDPSMFGKWSLSGISASFHFKTTHVLCVIFSLLWLWRNLDFYLSWRYWQCQSSAFGQSLGWPRVPCECWLTAPLPLCIFSRLDVANPSPPSKHQNPTSSMNSNNLGRSIQLKGNIMVGAKFLFPRYTNKFQRIIN